LSPKVAQIPQIAPTPAPAAVGKGTLFLFLVLALPLCALLLFCRARRPAKGVKRHEAYALRGEEELSDSEGEQEPPVRVIRAARGRR
ncbi:MAG: hypothetical protein SGPRY_008435, partial [Prymnesium sp.]